MRVVVTGPEGSGTRYLNDVVNAYIGVESEHRPMPNHDEWWAPSPEERYIIIQRRPDVTCLAILGQHAIWPGEPVRALRKDIDHARDWWIRAVEALAKIPDAFWVSYEALVADPHMQADNIARWLGVEPSGVLPPAFDANRKWLSFLE